MYWYIYSSIKVKRLLTLKSKVGKIGLDKLKTVHVDWSKLSNGVNNDVCVW